MNRLSEICFSFMNSKSVISYKCNIFLMENIFLYLFCQTLGLEKLLFS